MKRPLIAAALILSTLAAPAFAATDTFRMDVEFSRANLVTVEGALAEYEKIRDQVADRCVTEHPGTSRLNFARGVQIDACTERTLSAAIRDIADPNLTAVHTKAKG